MSLSVHRIDNLNLNSNIVGPFSATGTISSKVSVTAPIMKLKYLEFYNSTNSFVITFQAGVPTSNITWTWPDSDASISGSSLISNAAGVLSWSNGGGGGGTVFSISQGTNMSFSSNPISTSGTINLANTVTGLTSLSTAALGVTGLSTLGAITAVGTTSINASGTSATSIGNSSNTLVLNGSSVAVESSGSGLTINTTSTDTTSIGNVSGTLSLNGLTATLVSAGTITFNGTSIGLMNSSAVVPLRFYNVAETHYVALQAGNPSANVTWTLPTSDATVSGAALVSNAAGILSWTTGASGTVTSIVQGTNMSFSSTPITTTGTINLSNTLTGLTSIGVGSFTISSDMISSSTSAIVLAPFTTNAVQLNNGTNVTPLQFYNSAGTHFVALQAGNPTINVTWTLPLIDATVSGAALTSNAAGILSWSAGTVGTVTSISQGTNLSFSSNPLTTTGTINLSSTPSGLTSLGVGNYSISGSIITNTSSAIILAPHTSSAVQLNNGTNVTPLQFYNATGANYVAFQAGNPSANVTWTLPLIDATVSGAALTSNAAGILSWSAGAIGTVTSISQGTNLSFSSNPLTTTGTINLSSTPSGLTSLGVGNYSISSNTITNTSSAIILAPHTSSAVQLNNGTNVTPLQFYNATGSNYVALQAGNPSANVTWTLPLVDATISGSALTSNAAGVLSWSAGTAGTVTSISQGTNLSFSSNPLTTTGTINLSSTPSGLTSLGTAALTATGLTTLSGLVNATNSLTVGGTTYVINGSTSSVSTGGVSSTNVTGTSTSFTSSMVGGLLWFSTTQQSVITAVGSTTSLTLATAVTMPASSAATIYYGGVQNDLNGNLGVDGQTILNGNFLQNGAATFSTGTGLVSLNGTTTVGGTSTADSTSLFSISNHAATNQYLIVDTVNSQVRLSTTGSGNYCALLIGGGNSTGGVWGNFNTTSYGDSINLGYNFYPTNGLFGTSTTVIPDTGGGTSNISCNFGNILLQTGTINTAPTTKLTINSSGAITTFSSTILDDSLGNMTVTGMAQINKNIYLNNQAQNKMIALFDLGTITDETQQNFYGLGIGSNTLRYQVASTAGSHIFYAATSSSASNVVFTIAGSGIVTTTNNTLDNGGNMSLTGTFTQTGSGTLSTGTGLISLNGLSNILKGMYSSSTSYVINGSSASVSTGSAALTIVTGTSTTFTSAMKGGLFWFSTTQQGIVTNVISATSLVLSNAVTIPASSAAVIYYSGTQFDVNGNLGISNSTVMAGQSYQNYPQYWNPDSLNYVRQPLATQVDKPGQSLTITGTWTSVGSTLPSGTYTSIIWVKELSMFVAINNAGVTTTTWLLTSPDGILWTGPSLSPNTGQQWTSVCWSPSLGLLVAVNNHGSTGQNVATSGDGVTWTYNGSTSANMINLLSVCWSEDLQIFVAVNQGSTTSTMIWTSTTGTGTWIAQTSPNTSPPTSIVWSPELQLFVVVCKSVTSIWTSPNGTTWTNRTAPNSDAWNSVAWSPELGRFCAVATTTSTTSVMTSLDGITWTAVTTASIKWAYITWSSDLGMFIGLSSGSGTSIFYSTNGTSFSSITVPSKTYGAICWSKELSRFCAVCNSSTTTVLSPIAIPINMGTLQVQNINTNTNSTTLGNSTGNIIALGAIIDINNSGSGITSINSSSATGNLVMGNSTGLSTLTGATLNLTSTTLGINDSTSGTTNISHTTGTGNTNIGNSTGTLDEFGATININSYTTSATGATFIGNGTGILVFDGF